LLKIKRGKKMTKAIKIEYKNSQAIESELRAINGKKDSHTFYLSHQIDNIAKEAEEKLELLSIPKKYRSGAIYAAQSGEELPSAYKYHASTTSVIIERKSTGWYIIDIKSTTLYPRTKPTRTLRLTKNQDEIAIAFTRSKYLINWI